MSPAAVSVGTGRVADMNDPRFALLYPSRAADWQSEWFPCSTRAGQRMRELVCIYNAPNHFEDCWHRMSKLLNILLAIICLAASAGAQARRVWVLKTPDAIV